MKISTHTDLFWLKDNMGMQISKIENICVYSLISVRRQLGSVNYFANCVYTLISVKRQLSVN